MRKYLEASVIAVQVSAVIFFLAASLIGIYFEALSSYAIALLTILAPPLAFRYVCKEPVIGVVESEILGYLLEHQKNGKSVEEGTLYVMWEESLGIRRTRTMLNRLQQLKLIDTKKMRERNRSFNLVSPTWRTRLLLDP